MYVLYCMYAVRVYGIEVYRNDNDCDYDNEYEYDYDIRAIFSPCDANKMIQLSVEEAYLLLAS